MVVELRGNGGSLEAGINFVVGLGVGVESLAGEVRWLDERCIHCTACVAPCPTHALDLDRTSMTVSFDREKCIACELCPGTCAYQAMEILFD